MAYLQEGQLMYVDITDAIIGPEWLADFLTVSMIDSRSFYLQYQEEDVVKSFTYRLQSLEKAVIQ